MKAIDYKRFRRAASGAVALAVWLTGMGGLALAQTTSANLSPSLQEVLKLTQAHMSDDIVTAYVVNSGQVYSLSADDLLYLKGQGVSESVLKVLLQTKPLQTVATPTPAPAPAVPMTAPPAQSSTTYQMPSTPAPAVPSASVGTTASYSMATPPAGSAVNLPYFESQLSPYGSWVDLPTYGPAWRPNAAFGDAQWRPYFDHGYWQYTDSGWYWNSDYPFGDIVFHYGRWVRDYRYGWVWVPGYDWAPSWVVWREADGYAGWAPLPPAAYYEAGVGLIYGGGFAWDIDFGLAPDCFVFVGYDHFWEHNYRPWFVGRDRFDFVYRSSFVHSGYRFSEGRFVVDGIGREHMEAMTHRSVVADHVAIHDSRINEAREFDRTHAITHEQEIRSRPMSDPMRSAIEMRDHSEMRSGGGRSPSGGGGGFGGGSGGGSHGGGRGQR